MNINRLHLLHAVRLAHGIVPTRTNLEVLKGIYLDADKNILTVKANNNDDASLSTVVEGEGSGTWQAVPDASRLLAVLAESTCETLTLSKEGDELVIKTDFAETVLKDKDDLSSFPWPVYSESEDRIVVDANKLHDVLKRVVMYAADESARYALTGVKFERDEGKLVLVATNGKWMGVEEIPCTSCTADKATRVIPARAIKSLLSAIKGEYSTEIEIAFSGNNTHFSIGSTTVNTRNLEGTFPTWKEVFPKSHSVKLPLNAGSLLTVTRQASVMFTEETRGIEYTLSEQTLTAKSCDPVAGRAVVKLPVAYTGKDHQVRFDGKLMAGILAQWDGDTELEACLTKDNKVAVFHFPDSFRAVLVPLAKVGE